MSASELGPGGPFDSRLEIREESAGAPAPEDASLLESVLRQTAAMADSDEPPSRAEMEAVEEVGRRFAGRAFSLDPVVVELVGAMLLVQYGSQWNSPGLWRVVSERIARSIFEDPLSRERMERIWDRLSGGNS
jgi:hypothetical protein